MNGSPLDVETAFTVTALLGLVTHPANMMMSTIPQIVGLMTAFDRIQQYLLQPSRHDQRLSAEGVETHSIQAPQAVTFDQVQIKAGPPDAPLLDRLSFSLGRGSICMVCGPVGGGKSLLLKAILGEIGTASVGAISLSSKRIAYCEQSPWLPSGTF